MANYKIGVVGMSQVGLIAATAFAAKGFKTICYDADEKVIANVSDGAMPFIDENLRARIAKNYILQSFTSDLKALSECDLIFITLISSFEEVSDAAEKKLLATCGQLSAVMSLNACMIIYSPLSPGFTRSIPFDKKRLFFQVNTMEPAKELKSIMYPDYIVIGADRKDRQLPAAYQYLVNSFACSHQLIKYESAEMVKLSKALYLTAAVHTVNLLTELCESLEADWADLQSIFELDKQVNEKYSISQALDFSGNRSEDILSILINLSAKHGVKHEAIENYKKNLHDRDDWVFQMLEEHILNKIRSPVIAIWGISNDEIPRHQLAYSTKRLLDKIPSIYTKVHDFNLPDLESYGIKPCRSPISALLGADVLIIINKNKQYQNIDINEINRALLGKVIIDPFMVLDMNELDPSISYATIGRKNYIVLKQESHHA